jgi:hypothetical protein
MGRGGWSLGKGTGNDEEVGARFEIEGEDEVKIKGEEEV